MGGSASHAISPLPVGKNIIITGGNTGKYIYKVVQYSSCNNYMYCQKASLKIIFVLPPMTYHFASCDPCQFGYGVG
jgi:hypothetical protein